MMLSLRDKVDGWPAQADLGNTFSEWSMARYEEMPSGENSDALINGTEPERHER
jgi:hypothetical protein